MDRMVEDAHGSAHGARQLVGSYDARRCQGTHALCAALPCTATLEPCCLSCVSAEAQVKREGVQRDVM
jgi:hypothetical protein